MHVVAAGSVTFVYAIIFTATTTATTTTTAPMAATTSTTAAAVPAAMKAAIALDFGDIDVDTHIVQLRDDWPTPQFPSPVDTEKGDRDDDDPLVLIKVLACALAPGDARVLSGKTRFVQTPPGGLPYVIGSDVAGIVVALSPQAAAAEKESQVERSAKFQVGDYVVNRFDEPKPCGGLAEYRLCKSSLMERYDPRQCRISPIEACGLPASGMAAKKLARDYVRKGDNALVIGGSGGVGTMLIQYVNLYGAKRIVAVSTQEELCKSLGANRVVDYRTENWWDVPDFCQSEEEKFDVVFDLVNGGENWEKGGCAGTAVRRNGTYVALLPGVGTEIVVRNAWDMICLMFQMVGGMLLRKLRPGTPRWVCPEALRLEPGDLKELLDDVASNKVRPVLDPASPFEFTQDGVCDALRLQKSIHAHGKVVVLIS